MSIKVDLRKQYAEWAGSGYFFFVPERSLYSFMDKTLEDEDIYLLKPISFKKSYFQLFENECSVANVSVEDDGCLGQV